MTSISYYGILYISTIVDLCIQNIDWIWVKKQKRLVHGTLEGYKSFRCRCKRCSEVWGLYLNQYREEVFDETKARYSEVNIPITKKDYSERIENGQAQEN